MRSGHLPTTTIPWCGLEASFVTSQLSCCTRLQTIQGRNCWERFRREPQVVFVSLSTSPSSELGGALVGTVLSIARSTYGRPSFETDSPQQNRPESCPSKQKPKQVGITRAATVFGIWHKVFASSSAALRIVSGRSSSHTSRWRAWRMGI